MIHLKKQFKDPGAYNRGVEAYNRRDFFTAAKEFQEAVREHPGYADYHFALAMAWRELGELDQAVDALEEALKINPHFVQAKNELAILTAMRGNEAEAGDLFSEAVAQFIYNTEGVPGARAGELLEEFRRGIRQLSEGGYADAVLAFRKATNPKSGMGQMHYNQAVELFLQENFEEARIELEQALRIDPYLVDAHMLLAKIAWLEGNFEEARHASQRAVRIAPDYPDLHFHLALTSRALGMLDKARKELQRALELQPEYTQALLELADVAIEMDDFPKAEQALQDYSICGQSAHPRYDFLLGRLHEKQGQFAKARTYYCGIADDSLWGTEAKRRLEFLERLTKP